MSDTDSFISEVSEEVRNDQLFGYVKRYGWIAVALIILLVGGAAYSEWSKAKSQNAAQATGDALLDALNENDVAVRAEMLEAVPSEGSAAAVVDLLTADAQFDAGDTAGAVATLSALAVNQDVPQTYRDVAAFKSTLLSSEDGDPVVRRQTLEALAVPGQPFRLLALEQIALIYIADGDLDTAISSLRSILEDAAVTRGLRDRAESLIVALGEELEEEPVEELAPTTTE